MLDIDTVIGANSFTIKAGGRSGDIRESIECNASEQDASMCPLAALAQRVGGSWKTVGGTAHAVCQRGHGLHIRSPVPSETGRRLLLHHVLH